MRKITVDARIDKLVDLIKRASKVELKIDEIKIKTLEIIVTLDRNER